MRTTFETLTRTMQSLDEETKDALLRWMAERLERASIEDQATQRALLGDLIDLTDVSSAVPPTPTQRFAVTDGWLERTEVGEYWGRLELAPAVSLIFVMDATGAKVSFTPNAPEFVATGWE